ncbi:acyltransferase [Aureimonas flava]|uniref:Acyltransferase n=1 Tax=Aureimonas flava TaxID=2320271 RepID=A0A3A1WP10_9HYPH|nr:acyltransferase [Aureimonas flava]RIY02473.1 acyltransferase [Aureimonas flava]
MAAEPVHLEATMPAVPNRQSADLLVNVQILRLVAALLVVFTHAHFDVSNIAARRGTGFASAGLLDWGLGVDIFFVISGFIMYYTMRDRFGEPGVARDFLRRRAIRVVPLYWIVTTLMLASTLAVGSAVNNPSHDPAHILASYLFLPWPRADGLIFPVLSLGWTLNYEMLFYLVFALALGLGRRAGLLLVGAAFAALWAAAAAVPAEVWWLRFWGNSVIGEFLLGIGLAMAYVAGVRLGGAAAAALLAAGTLLAVWLFQVSAFEHLPRLVTGGLPALLIAAGAALGPPARDMPMTRLLVFGGAASYALYLAHPFALRITSIVGDRLGLPLPLILVLCIGAALLGSAAVHLWVERPIGARLGRWTVRRRSHQPA